MPERFETRSIDPLRVPHPTDRRATLVEITESGQAALVEATKAVTDVDFGLAGERASARTNAPSDTTVNAPYAGLGIHF